MLILDLWGISFHAVVVFALGKKLLFKSALGHCESLGPYGLHIRRQMRSLVRMMTFVIGARSPA